MPTVEAQILWDAKLQFTGAGSENQFPLRLDASPGAGENKGATPMETVLIALGGCTGMDVISILRKMREDVTGYEIRLRGERADDHPRVYTEILEEHILTGRSLDRANVEKAVRLSETKYRSVSKTLTEGVDVRHTFSIIDEPGAGAPTGPGGNGALTVSCVAEPRWPDPSRGSPHEYLPLTSGRPAGPEHT